MKDKTKWQKVLSKFAWHVLLLLLLILLIISIPVIWIKKYN